MKQKGNKKELNSKQANNLFKDILDQDVKRFGGFIIGKYFVTVYNKVALTNLERVRKHYELNPGKLTEMYSKRRRKYQENKKKGICVKCGKRKAVNKRAMCKKCKVNDLEWQRKRKLNRQIKV